MGNGKLAWPLILVGILAVNYAYLHDIVWQTHHGVIVMGVKSYLLALAGTLLVLAGAVLRGQGR